MSSTAQPSSEVRSETGAEKPGAPPKPARRLPRLVREPLLHFLLLGVLLFVADRALRPPDPPRDRIEATPEVVAQLKHDFREQLRREPSAAETQALVREWVDRQVLFREGVKLGLATGDPIVQNRVAQRMRDVLEQLVEVAEPTEADLEQWLRDNASRYATQRRFSFVHVYATGAQGRARAEALAKRLAEGADFHALGDAFGFSKRFDARSEHNIRSIFGDGFVEALSAAPRDEWTIIESKHGWHAVRSLAVTGGNPTLSDVKPMLAKDFKDAQRARLVKARIQELARQYQAE